MKRYAAYDRRGKFAIRVFADRPREALVKSKRIQKAIRTTAARHREMLTTPGSSRPWFVVEDPMAQVTRGD